MPASCLGSDLQQSRLSAEPAPIVSQRTRDEHTIEFVLVQGLRFRLQLEHTKHCGWGLISWDTIPSGAFVAIYYGKVRDSLVGSSHLGMT